MRLVVLGLSLSSSWGNGHATTYRSLLRAFAARGHEVLFLERDVPWYRGRNRDLAEPDFCRLAFYDDLAGLGAYRAAGEAADAVGVGSYVPEGRAVGAWAQRTARGAVAFYDIDTPVTVAALERGDCAYLSPDLIPGYAPYLSFTGGPMLDRLAAEFRSPAPRALYCCVDPDRYRPRSGGHRFDLSYLGTYSDDRQPALERLLLGPARRAPDLRFCVAGPQYPASIDWPANVTRFEHVGPTDHSEFYGVSRFTLNVTRADMVRAGWSPSVRLFEAAACGTPIISDPWDGLDAIFADGRDILVARDGDAVLGALIEMAEPERRALGEAGRARVLERHTAAHRAAELEGYIGEALRRPRPALARVPGCRGVPPPPPCASSNPSATKPDTSISPPSRSSATARDPSRCAAATKPTPPRNRNTRIGFAIATSLRAMDRRIARPTSRVIIRLGEDPSTIARSRGQAHLSEERHASSAAAISPSAAGSSTVAGMVHSAPSAIFFMVPRRILPERVFGRRPTATASLNDATGPIRSRTSATASRSTSAPVRAAPALSTRKPSGASPFSGSATPMTAHSATSGCAASTSSMPPVDRRWPATLMMSSVRPITHT